MSLTDSPPPTGSATDADARADVVALEKEILKHSRVGLLGKMAGVKSISRNLKSEDRICDRDSERESRALWGGDEGPAAPYSEDDPMDIMAAGNVTYNAPAAPSPPPPSSKLASTLIPLALGALLATTGIGAIGAALIAPTIIDALKSKPQVNVPPHNHTFQERAKINVGKALVTTPGR